MDRKNLKQICQGSDSRHRDSDYAPAHNFSVGGQTSLGEALHEETEGDGEVGKHVSMILSGGLEPGSLM